MRQLLRLSFLMVTAVAMLASACNNDKEADGVKSPTIALELKSVTATEATFTITTTNATEAYIYCAEPGAEVTAESIKTRGKRVNGSEAVVDGLNAETSYVAYAVALNQSKSTVAEKPFTTSVDDSFNGYEFNKMVSAVYRTDNDAVAGNYEVTFGNCTTPEWVGDIQVYLDLYNVEDSDPLNPVLPNGTYEPGTDFAPFTYNPSYSYVDVVVEGGEIVSSPIFGTVTVARTAATYTITVEGELMLLENTLFSARYTGTIEFVQGGTSSYEFFDEDITLELDEAQMRYWGGWFHYFADDVGLEMFSGDFNENGTLTRGYYLHISPLYMPVYEDYNAENVPLADGIYKPVRDGLTTGYYQPYSYTKGYIGDLYGERFFAGTYLQYVENGAVKGVGLVADGDIKVVRNGDNYNIVMGFVADNGVKLNLTYNGTINSVNYNDNDTSMPARPWTTLTEDHVYNFPAETKGYAYCLGDMIKEGYNSWMLMIFAYNNQYPDGYGDMFTTEFAVQGGERTELPTGEFKIAMEVEDKCMYPGHISHARSVMFTYYGDLTPDAEGYSTHSAPITDGSVVIEEAGNGNYKFTFNLVDDGGNKITGEWTGIVYVDDISDEIAGTSSTKAQVLRASR